MKALYKYIITLAVLLAALACLAGVSAGGQKPPPPAEPPADCSCAECGMYVRDKFGAQIIFTSGKAAHFCDTGDLFVYYDVSKKKDTMAAVYVKDFPSGTWTDGRAAYYIAGTSVKTPMGYGILAFRDRAQAEKYGGVKGGERFTRSTG